ncbi:b5 reductase 1 [Seminavis robusta]|uniref:B5 reductase 1 n=1 Tax=Seminavis robusta TaxID=568900 RepID=A0A9N8DX07_9STRA|nr:b5 reductase 1 [Seminavis robusta]|eukprot:Sro428_g140900.1 b5 reductase 1 (260) ;mRNA; r:47839-48618
MVSTETPWWLGAPTKLIKKTTLVPAAPNHLPVHTLTFAIPKDDSAFSGRAKPHSEVAIELGDVVKMVIPGYKPKSYSMSAIRDGEFDITFKVYPNGRASGFLDRLNVGDEMGTFGMTAGRHRNPGSFVGCIAFGVGITECLPVAQAELEKGDAEKVVLLWASRTMADTFWHDKIEDLKKKYPDRFQMAHILSREERQGCLKGRINPELLDQVFQPEDRSQARFLSVGTKEMMRMTDKMLEEIDYPMPQHALLPKSQKHR